MTQRREFEVCEQNRSASDANMKCVPSDHDEALIRAMLVLEDSEEATHRARVSRDNAVITFAMLSWCSLLLYVAAANVVFTDTAWMLPGLAAAIGAVMLLLLVTFDDLVYRTSAVGVARRSEAVARAAATALRRARVEPGRAFDRSALPGAPGQAARGSLARSEGGPL